MPPAAYLDQRLHLSLGAFTVDQLNAVRGLFVHDNPEYDKWVRYKPTPWPPKQTVGTWKQSGGYLHVPRGRMSEVLGALKAAGPVGTGLGVDDRRQVGRTHSFKLTGLDDREYQTRLVDLAVEHETCLWRSPQGSGKTSTAFRFIERVGVSSLVVVPNRALLDQWAKRVRSHFRVEPSIIQGKRKQPGPITIALQPSLLTCIDEVAPYFGAIVCDEVQLFAAKTFNAIIEQCPARYRLGISGDERRADGKEYLIHDQFGEPPAGGIVERTEMLDQGHIVDVELRFVATDFRADWYVGLSPKQKFDQRTRLIEEMGASDERNQVALQCARWCLDEGEQVAVLAMRREHCQRLDAMITTLCPSGLLLGGEGDRDTFEDSLKHFAGGDLKAVVGTFKAIGVGFETHAALARGVFVSPVVTSDTAQQQLMQYLGRFARPSPGKQRAVVYFLYDPHVHGTKPLKLARKWVRHVSVVTDSGVVVPVAECLKAPRRHAQTNRSEAAAATLPGIVDTTRGGFYD